MQEEPSIISIPTQSEVKKTQNTHFWAIWQIYTTAFFATPFAGFYLISKNFKLLQLNKAAKNSIIIGIFANVILMPLLAVLAIKFWPKIPHILIPIVLAIMTQSFAQHKQEETIKQWKRNGSKRHSIIRWILITIVLGIISVILFIIPFLLIMYFLGPV